jgi:succinate dehydrogenase/fumarate reductase flavoprotein subunit
VIPGVAQSEGEAAVATVQTYETDVLVIGAGMAGMTAAFCAAINGARVTVIEVAPAIGGSAVLSGTHLWTATSLEQHLEQCPDADPVIARAFHEGFAEAAGFVRSSGVEFTEDLQVLFGRGNRFDIVSYFERAQQAVERGGGSVHVNTQVQSLLFDEGGVAGVRAIDAGGVTDIKAHWTVLATGGFQANRALTQRYLGDRSARVLLRSNPYSSGEGLRLGLSVGGQLSGHMDDFYGHLIAWPLPEFTPTEFARFACLWTDAVVLLNLDGQRFTDESLGDHVNAQRVAEQRQGRAVAILDENLHKTRVMRPHVAGIPAYDEIAESREVGAHATTAETLEELGRQISGWGFAGGELPRVIADYNALLTSGRDGQPPRSGNRIPFGAGPYYALEVKPGMTFTEGGLRVDVDGQVVGESGEPVGRLSAAGGDVGGVFSGGYAGGLALAAVFGLKGGQLAAAASSRLPA